MLKICGCSMVIEKYEHVGRQKSVLMRVSPFAWCAFRWNALHARFVVTKPHTRALLSGCLWLGCALLCGDWVRVGGAEVQFIAESEDLPVVQQRRGRTVQTVQLAAWVRRLAVGAAMRRPFWPQDSSSVCHVMEHAGRRRGVVVDICMDSSLTSDRNNNNVVDVIVIIQLVPAVQFVRFSRDSV